MRDTDRVNARVVLAVAALLLAGCESGSVRSLRSFWSRFETNIVFGRHDGPLPLDWNVDEPTPATRRISGYVYNTTNYRIARIYLRIESLDARERVLAIRYWWVMGDAPANDRAYFDAPELPAADHYRVSVYSYVIEADPLF